MTKNGEKCIKSNIREDFVKKFDDIRSEFYIYILETYLGVWVFYEQVWYSIEVI